MFNERMVEELSDILGKGSVLTSLEDLIVYETDALTLFKGKPYAVILPSSTEEVSKSVKICCRENVPFIPRGAGTSLSGATNPENGAIIISFSRMNKVIEIDIDNCLAVVEAGLVNIHLSEQTSGTGLHYAPDPSSQPACTIGGNISHNSGGPHTLKYGVTTNHVLGLEVVLPDGEIVQLGGKTHDSLGYDLVGIMAGSEGTLGIITKAIVSLTPVPETIKTFLASFKNMNDASKAVSHVISAGIIPAAIEMMDNLAINAVEASIHSAGYPKDAGAVLLIEIDGANCSLNRQVNKIIKICRSNYATDVIIAKDQNERKKLWAGRKGAFGAMGRIGPDYYVQDGVIPRSKLPEILRIVSKTAHKYGLKIANVFHAGDGNIHPLISFDSRIAGQTDKVIKAGEEIITACVSLGGSITGEHGVGIEKRDLMPLIFSKEDLSAMKNVKSIFNPNNLCNPGKIFPTSSSCVDAVSKVGVPVGW